MRLIDADALIQDAMERYCKDCERRKGIKNGKLKIVYSIGDAPCRACGTGDMIDELENAPTIEPERKKGRWTLQDGYRCSVCNYKLQTTGLPTHCPNCGCDMRQEGEDYG